METKIETNEWNGRTKLEISKLIDDSSRIRLRAKINRMKTKELKQGMYVIHESWDSGKPLYVTNTITGLKLKCMETGELTDVTAGGESEDGWVEARK